MTERLYYTDAYCAEFEGHVVERSADPTPRVYLDRTAFYPTSGGQPHDRGELNGVEVLDVLDEGERIAHVLAAPLPAETVRGRIDWTRRYDFMQQHSGQHLLSALCADSLGAATLSVHFGADSSTLDLDIGALGEAQLEQLERHANEIAREQRPVSVSFESPAEASGLRKTPARSGLLRIVSIAGIDRSACGGTHVHHTGEIAPILLRRTERVKKATRLEFLCGARAVAQARRDFLTLTRLAQRLSTALDDLAPVFEAQLSALREAESARRRLAEELDQERATSLLAAVAPDAAGLRRILRRPAALEDVRGLALALAAQPRALFVAVSETPPAIMLAASEDSGVNAGEALRAAVTAAGGRGGGSPRLAQGTVPSAAELDTVVRQLLAMGEDPA